MKFKNRVPTPPFHQLQGLTGLVLQRRAADLAHEIGDDALAEIIRRCTRNDEEVWGEILWRYGSDHPEAGPPGTT